MMQFQSRAVAIVPQSGPVAIMHYTTQGRGSVLPTGAEWLQSPSTDKPLGWWARPVTDALVFEQITRAYAGNGYPMPSRYVILPADAELPQDRTYRAAWVLDGDAVVIDLPKAREAHRDCLREARAVRMTELDVAYMRAIETGQGAEGIAAEKRALRDITGHPSIEAAQSVEELKAVTLGLL